MSPSYVPTKTEAGTSVRVGFRALPLMAQTWRSDRACPLCPGISDINLFRYRQGVIDLDAEIPDRAFNLGMPEQKLDGPEISRPPVDQGGFCASQRMRTE